MGLDGVELLLCVEETFAIDIPDGDAGTLGTPRQLAHYLHRRLGEAPPRPQRCDSQRRFHHLRSVLMRQFGARRRQIRPEAPVHAFLKGADMRAQWRQLRQALCAGHLPELQCERSLYYRLNAGLALVATTLLLAAGASPWLLPLAWMLSWLTGEVLAQKLARVVPPALNTLAALLPHVHLPHTPWTLDDILHTVIQITACQCDLPAEQIHPDQHFVRDLGLD